jgi:hypothetical protein
MRFYLPIGKHLLGVNFRVSLKKREGSDVVAIANKVGNKYVLFLDYDIQEKHVVYEDIAGLQETYQLGNAYIFTTKKGFHVIFLDVLSYAELCEILDASTCDEHYKYVSRKNNNRTWVLRITDKKNNNKVEFKEILWASQCREMSYPHSRFLVARGVPEWVFEDKQQYMVYENRKLLFVKYRA